MKPADPSTPIKWPDAEFWRMYGERRMVRVDNLKEADMIVITHKLLSDRYEKRTG